MKRLDAYVQLSLSCAEVLEEYEPLPCMKKKLDLY